MTSEPGDAGRLPSVVHVVWQGSVGGIERVVHDLAYSQAESQGHRVGILYAQSGGPFYESSIRQPAIEVHVADYRNSVALRPGAVWRARRFLASFDVVHVHVYNPATMITASLSARSTVCTLHGIPRATWGLKRWAALPLRRWFLRRAACVTANSAYCRDANLGWLGLSRRDVEVIWNGVPAPQGTGAAIPGLRELRDAGARLVVGFLGRFVAFKRVDRVVAVVRSLPAAAGVALALAGDGELADSLKRAAAGGPNSQHIAFLGTVDRVADFLAAIDVLVVPSKGEPYGLVIAEAALCGTPVIVVSDGGGAVEVAAVANGTVVGSPDELRACLLDLAEHGVSATMRPDVSAVSKAVSMDTMTRRFYRVYLRALGGHGSRR